MDDYKDCLIRLMGKIPKKEKDRVFGQEVCDIDGEFVIILCLVDGKLQRTA